MKAGEVEIVFKIRELHKAMACMSTAFDRAVSDAMLQEARCMAGLTAISQVAGVATKPMRRRAISLSGEVPL